MIRHLFISLMSRVHAFVRAESGMTLPAMALSMLLVTNIIGFSIDVGRMQLVQSKLQFSLDAAGLAGGSTVSTTSLNSEVTKYLNANFNGYLGATVSGVTATPDSSNTIITLNATASMPSTFMSMLGISTITVQAKSQVSRAITGLELVMVLDNTGSMANSAGGSTSKISALKTAANTLVSTLFNGQSTSTNGKLWVGIVPFSQAVNIGTTHTTWLNTTYDNANYGDWGPSNSWGGCVDARLNGEDVNDDPPSVNTPATLFRQYYWTSDNLNTDGVSNSGSNVWKRHTWKRCKSNGTNCSTVYDSCSTSGGYTCTATADWYASPLNTTSKGPNLNCPLQVTPMTNSATTLTNSINAMTPLGDTIIPQGMQWGWNMLSPRWRGYWGGTMNANNLPLDYGTKGMVKAIVMLTDGVNTIDNSAHGAYWFLGDKVLGTNNSNTAITDMDNNTRKICTALKNNGVYIYTIALGTDTTTASLQLLQDCATASNYYFNSPSTTQLQGIFSAIGDSLSNLRVSQ